MTTQAAEVISSDGTDVSQAVACVVALATLPFDTSLTMNTYAFVLLAGNFIIRWAMR